MHRRMIALACLTLLAAPAVAQPMRCATQIIGPGDNMERVLEFCGRPTAARHWIETINTGDDDDGWGAVQIPMAEWDYDSNPDSFPSKIIFRNGIVQEIRN